MSSDIDLLVLTKSHLSVDDKRKLAQLFLHHSQYPYPVEISFLNQCQLSDWEHPCPYDFHYSEYWRERYEAELSQNTSLYINNEPRFDADLAAHITILAHRGIVLDGPAIEAVFPVVPSFDYISSILGDYRECMEKMLDDPVYCILNILRVYWHLKEGIIASKLEAGEWALSTLPNELKNTIRKVIHAYSDGGKAIQFEEEEIYAVRDYAAAQIQQLLDSNQKGD